MTARIIGTVKWFNKTKGFGFISLEAGDDILFYSSAIRGDRDRSLKPDEQVEFTIQETDKGPQAQEVISLS